MTLAKTVIFFNSGNDQIQNEEMAYWSSIVGQAVASGIITPDFKSALGEKVFSKIQQTKIASLLITKHIIKVGSKIITAASK